MKIKRFLAPDIRQAIKLVRDELGPDAVILSNRSVDGGVEIVSAVDYDESLVGGVTEATGSAAAATPKAPKTHPKTASVAASPAFASLAKSQAAGMQAASTRAPEVGVKNAGKSAAVNERAAALSWNQEPALAEMREELRSLRNMLEHQLSGFAWGDLERRHPLRVQLLRKLSKLGLSAPLCSEIAEAVRNGRDLESMWQEALDGLASRILTTDDDILNHGGVVALVGPTGVGKTTTVAKLAARYALRYGARNVALVTIDGYRIGAYEQLRAYGRILDIPVRLATTDEDLRKTLEDMRDRRLVLIDTTGMSQRDLRLPEQMRLLSGGRDWLKTYLVLSTTTRLSSLEEIAGVYAAARPAGCILTKVDETTCLGSAISAVVQHRLPVAYISDGQRVPEDLHTARAASLVARSVTIMQEHENLLEEELFTNVVGRPGADAHL